MGIEQLRNGDSLSYQNVVFCWDQGDRQNELLVLSYSDCLCLENVKPEEAENKISRSKEIAQELLAASPAFREVWQSAGKRFQFCVDYHTSAAMLAEEVDGEIVWHVKLPSEGETRGRW